MADRGANSLSRRERQIWRELEADLRVEESELATSVEHPPRLGRLRRALRLRRSAAWIAAILGVVVLLLGLAASAAPFAFVGFVVLLVGTNGLVTSRSMSETIAATVGWFGKRSNDDRPG